MGFSNRWVKAVSSLYSSATSKVMMVRGKGSSFRLSRSIRQGCPMAPYLFLLFVEMMSSFLIAKSVGLHGLQLPQATKAMLDAEFADNTTLYMKGRKFVQFA